MKKFFLSTCMAIMAICGAKAQTPLKYRGEVDLGYSIGGEIFDEGRVNLHTIQGVRIGKYFSTGLGVGLDYYHTEQELIIPIFLNIKGYLPISRKTTPYLSLDIGGGINAFDAYLPGLYCTPAIGIQLRKFKAQIGYNVQRISDRDMNAIQIKIGVVF